MDAAGNFVIVWESFNQDGSGSGIYGQRYSAAGIAQGGEFRVNTTTFGNQIDASVAMDAAGNFVIAWTDNTQDGNNGGVYAQRYDANGVAQGGEFRGNTTTLGDQRYASVDMSASGAFVITWSSDGQDGSGYGVFAQRYSSAGVAQGGEIQVNTTTLAFQGYSDVALDPLGNFVITWSCSQKDGNGSAVVGRQFAADGTPSSAEFIVNTTTSGNQIDASVAVDGLGRFVVVWSGNGAGDTDGVFLRRYEPVTTEAGGTAVFQVALATQPVANVTIGLSLSDGTEASLSVPSLTFTAANWNTPQIVTVTGLDDSLDDGDVAYSLITAAASSADPNYNGLTAADVALVNLDDTDTAGITVSTRDGAETRVNTTTADTQYAWTAKSLATDASGNAVIVWASGGAAPFAIYAQRLDASGAKVGPEIQVNTNTTPEQFEPAVAMAANGDFVVVWTSDVQDGDGYGVYCQRFNSAGVAQGGEFRVNTTTASEQSGPVVAMDDTGNFVIAWTSYDAATGSDPDVHFQRYNSAGVAQGGETRVNTNTSNYQIDPVIAMNGSGQFVVVWESKYQDGNEAGVYGQRFDAAGNTISTEFQVNTYTTGDQYNPSVAMDDSGAFVVAWDSNGQDGSAQGVYLQRFDAAGNKVGTEIRANTYTTGSQLGSAVAFDPAGGFVVAWTSMNQDNGTMGVYGQRFSAAGATLGTEFRINTTSADIQREPSVAFGQQGRLLVAWAGNGPGDDSGVFLQRYLPTFTTEAGHTTTFTVVLDSQPTDDVTIAIATSDATESTVSTPSLTFTAANWNTPQVVTVTGLQDFINDGDIIFSVLTGTASSADPNYNGLDPADVVLANLAVANLAPVNTVPSTQTMNEDGTLVFSVANGNLISISDADAGSNTLQVTLTGTNGTLTLAGTTGLSFTVGDGAADATMTFTGSVASINAALAGMSFSPTANFNGAASLQIVTNDLANSGTGGARSDTDTVAITVAAVNDAPVASNDTYTIDEDQTLTVGWWDTDWSRRQALTFDNSAQAENLTDFPVLVVLNSGNIDYSITQDGGQDLRFFDADGTPLAYEIEQWNEAGTSYVWVKVPRIDAGSAADSIWMYYGNATCASGETPAAVWNSGYAGVWHLSEAQTGTGNAGVYQDSTSPSNDGTDNVAAAGKDGQIGAGQQFGGTGQWIEVPHDASLNLQGEMSISFWIKPTENTTTFNRVVEKGMWGYQTSYYFGGGNGSNDLTFYLNNTEVFDTADNVLTVGAWQQATVTYTSAGTAKLFLNGTQIASGTYAGPITGNTGPVYISHPNATYDFPGSIDEVRIENVARSDAWVKAQYKSMANTFVSFGGEQSAPGVGGVLGNDTDVEGDALRAVLVSGPAHGSLSLKADGTFSYTPDANWNGTDSFTYKANDGSLDSAPATVTITVNPANDAPTVANPIADQNATEDSAFSFQFASNTFADVDVGDTLTYTASGVPGLAQLRCRHADLQRHPRERRRRPGDDHRARDGRLSRLRRRPVRAHGRQRQRCAHRRQSDRRSERHRRFCVLLPVRFEHLRRRRCRRHADLHRQRCPGLAQLRFGDAHLLRHAHKCRRRPGDDHRARHRCQPRLRRRPVRAHGRQRQRCAHRG